MAKRALSKNETQEILDLLNSKDFQDHSPSVIYAKLLDQERQLCSIRTMYRILAAHKQVKASRRQFRHPCYKKPELLATGPKQVWSWDVTNLQADIFQRIPFKRSYVGALRRACC